MLSSAALQFRRREALINAGTVYGLIIGANQLAVQPQAQRLYVEVGVNDDRFNAYVDSRSAPLSAQAGVASYQASEGQRQRAVRIAPYRRGR